MSLSDLRNKLERAKGRRQGLLEDLELERKELKKAEHNLKVYSESLDVLNASLAVVRKEMKSKIDDLVTSGLNSVFSNDLIFEMKVSSNRSRFSTVPVLKSSFNGIELETDIADGHGGGVSDIVSFVLRVIVMCLSRPRLRRVMVLDESFRHVSPEYLRGVSVLLKELNKKLGIQFLMVTHKEELLDAADVVYRTKNVDGETAFTLEHDLRDELYHQKASSRGLMEDEVDLFCDVDLNKPFKEDEHVEPEIEGDLLAKQQKLQRSKKLKIGRKKKKKPVGRPKKTKRIGTGRRSAKAKKFEK